MQIKHFALYLESIIFKEIIDSKSKSRSQILGNIWSFTGIRFSTKSITGICYELLTIQNGSSVSFPVRNSPI